MTTSARGSEHQARRPGRPPAVEPGAIAEAVLRQGIRQMTFASIAAELGVGQATLYRHAANRDALAMLGLDLAVTRHTWPDTTGPWPQMLQKWAEATWQLLADTPGAAAELARGHTPSALVSLGDRIGAGLLSQGFEPAPAMSALDLLLDLVIDHRNGIEAREDNVRDPDERRDEEIAGTRALVERWLEAEPYEEPQAQAFHAQVRAAVVANVQRDPLEWLREKLRVVIAGIAVELGPRE